MAKRLDDRQFVSILKALTKVLNEEVGYVRFNAHTNNSGYGFKSVAEAATDPVILGELCGADIIIEKNTEGTKLNEGRNLFSVQQLANLAAAGVDTKIPETSFGQIPKAMRNQWAREIIGALDWTYHHDPVLKEEPKAWVEKRAAVAALDKVVALRQEVRAMLNGSVKFHEDE